MKLIKEKQYKITLVDGEYLFGQFELTTLNLELCFFIGNEYVYIEPGAIAKIEEV